MEKFFMVLGFLAASGFFAILALDVGFGPNPSVFGIVMVSSLYIVTFLGAFFSLFID